MDELYYKDNSNRIIIKCGHTVKCLETHKILYIEVFDRQLIIHYQNSKDEIYGRLYDMAQRLVSYGFIQCHRCYVVNMNHIASISSTQVELSDNRVIPIGRSYKQNVKEAFIKHIQRGKTE